MVSYKEILAFHGHNCPGLAMGYRMTVAALELLKEVHAEDEELFAITENDACGVDALQCLTGCTFGKGNLFFRDFGKHVFTLFSRKSGRAVRVYFHGLGIPEKVGQDRTELTDWILSAPVEDILSLQEVVVEDPGKAVSRDSQICSFCGERVMVSRTRVVNGKTSCIPCSRQVSAHWSGFCKSHGDF